MSQNKAQKEEKLTTKDVEPALQPLMETTPEWFGEEDQYMMETGGMGVLSSISPYGAIFNWINNGSKSQFYPTRTKSLESLIAEEDENKVNVINLDPDTDSLDQEFEIKTTWKKEVDGKLYIFEYVPFSSPVTTTDDLKGELNEIMHATPDFEELFEETRQAN